MKYYPQFKSLLLDSFINALQDTVEETWSKNKNYIVSTQVVSGNLKYISLDTGISGIYQPTHTYGIKSDGGIRWLYVEPYTHTDTFLKNIYLSIAHTDPWVDDNNPPEPVISENTRTQLFEDIITVQKIYSSDISFGLPKNDWQSGVVYNRYDNQNAITNTYVTTRLINGSVNVYRCIDNNNGAVSTEKPSTSSVNNFYLSDGYVWKFLYNISYNSLSKFRTTNFYPIRYIKPASVYPDSISTLDLITQVGDFNPLLLTSNIPFSVKSTSLLGTGLVVNCDINHSISSLRVINGGKNYEKDSHIIIYPQNALGTNAEITPIISNNSITGFNITNNGTNYTNATILIIGDGINAEATAQIVNGSITNIIMDNIGSGYTTAIAYVVAGTGAAAYSIVPAPYNGHGTNIIKELNITNLIISTLLDGDSTYYQDYIDQDFRQICLLTDITDNTNLIANTKNLIGKAHTKYNTLDTFKRMSNDGTLLYIDNIEPRRLTTNESLQIKITIAL
ncbi:MAG: hypothetical protein WC679_00880 [Bacteroidales bacterium]|jgi:hypothetical protein